MGDKGEKGPDLGLDETTEATWTQDEIDRILLETVDVILLDQVYSDQYVNQWVNAICEMAMGKLNELKKPFKYVVSCLIMQKNGAGVHCSHSAFWDTTSDGMTTLVWPKDKAKDQGNKTIQAVVTVVGCEF